MSDVDVNSIKAGTYELVATQWDRITSEPGKPLTFERYRRGDKVKLDEADAKRLMLAGAIVEPGSIQRAAAERARAQYLAALAQLPPEMQAELAAGTLSVNVDGQTVPIGAANTGTATGGDGAGGGDGDGDDRPKKAAAKDAWVAYAVSRGMSQEDAGAKTKDELIAAYGD
jgi:hypothetical protein